MMFLMLVKSEIKINTQIKKVKNKYENALIHLSQVKLKFKL